MSLIQSSFDFITTRGGNKKHLKNLFDLNGCKYFAKYCYLDYLERNNFINLYDNDRQDNRESYIKSFNCLSNKIENFNLKNHTLYSFDSSFDHIRGNDVVVCYIYKKTKDGINTIHTFILESNIIYNSYYVTEDLSIKNKKYKIDELNGKRIYNDENEVCSILMPPTKVVINNVYQKLNKLLVRPSLKLLNELFGLSKEHILTKIHINDFKNASIIYVKLNV